MINKVKSSLDYLYYRCYCYYVKHRHRDPIFMSVLIVSLFETMLVIAIFFIAINHFLEIGRGDKQQLNMLKIAGVILGVSIFYINYTLFKRKSINTLKQKWDSEELSLRRRKGWLVVLLLVAPIILIVTYSYLRNNVRII